MLETDFSVQNKHDLQYQDMYMTVASWRLDKTNCWLAYFYKQPIYYRLIRFKYRNIDFYFYYVESYKKMT